MVDSLLSLLCQFCHLLITDEYRSSTSSRVPVLANITVLCAYISLEQGFSNDCYLVECEERVVNLSVIHTHMMLKTYTNIIKRQTTTNNQIATVLILKATLADLNFTHMHEFDYVPKIINT